MLRWANAVAEFPGGAENGELMRIKIEHPSRKCTPIGKALDQADTLTAGDYGYYLSKGM